MYYGVNNTLCSITGIHLKKDKNVRDVVFIRSVTLLNNACGCVFPILQTWRVTVTEVVIQFGTVYTFLAERAQYIITFLHNV
jgi:hypothetical protein